MGFLIIGITGKAGSGKDTVADYLQADFEFSKYGFADPLKKAVCAAFDLHPKQVYDPDKKEDLDDYWNVTPREILQFVGTELFRDGMEALLPGIGYDFWVKRAEKRFRQLEGYGYPGVVINDVRFKNEGDWVVANNGILIEVFRPDTSEVGIKGHVSEAGFDKTSYGDKYIRLMNVGSKSQLQNQVSTLYHEVISKLA